MGSRARSAVPAVSVKRKGSRAVGVEDEEGSTVIDVERTTAEDEFEQRMRGLSWPFYALTGTLLPLCITTVGILEVLQITEGLTGSQLAAGAIASMIPFILMTAGLVAGWRSTVGVLLLICGAAALAMTAPYATLPFPAIAVVVLTAFSCAVLNMLEARNRMRRNVEEGCPLFS
jgi:hypothetical protein